MSIKLAININSDSSAFDDLPEIELARILRKLANEVENYDSISQPRDINGNKCGSISLELCNLDWANE